MKNTYALCQGEFGRVTLLELQVGLVPHSHSRSQIAFWLGGSPAQAKIGDTTYQYENDVALGINPYESHDVTLSNPGESTLFLTFEFRQSWINKHRLVSGKGLYFSKPTVPIDVELYNAVHSMLNIMLNPYGVNDKKIELTVADILVKATQASLNNIVHLESRIVKSFDHRVQRAIMTMRSNSTRKMSVNQLAECVGLSRSQLHVLFRKNLNSTPSVVANLLVVEEAIRRMLKQKDSLIDISLELGFSTQGNFSRFFKEHTGVSPSVYRSAVFNQPEMNFLSD